MKLTSLERIVKISIWNGESIVEVSKRLNKKESTIKRILTSVINKRNYSKKH